MGQQEKDQLTMPKTQETRVPFLVGGNGNPLQYSCLKKSHEQRSLVGYSPVDCKE